MLHAKLSTETQDSPMLVCLFRVIGTVPGVNLQKTLSLFCQEDREVLGTWKRQRIINTYSTWNQLPVDVGHLKSVNPSKYKVKTTGILAKDLTNPKKMKQQVNLIKLLLPKFRQPIEMCCSVLYTFSSTFCSEPSKVT